MDLIQKLFEDKLIDDDRNPVWTYPAQNDLELRFFPPNYLYFVLIALLLSFQMLIGCLLGVVMYHGIIHPLGQDDNRSSSIQRYIIGYGIVIPIALSLPFYILDYLDVRNLAFRLGLNSLPLTITLNCLEAMHGFLPVAANTPGGVWTYAASVGLIVRPKFVPLMHDDDDGINSKSKAQQQQQLKYTTIKSFLRLYFVKHLFWMGVFAVAFHLTWQSDFFPFPASAAANQVLLSFEIGHLYNTFVQAAMMNMGLAFSLSGVSALSSLLTGLECEDTVTDNPMFQSTSPSDFWGRRWNNLIHQGLKQGVYKPVRWSTGSPTLAAVMAFCVSGLLHEYVWWIMFLQTTAQQKESELMDDGCCPSCYCDAWFGKQIIFFCWNGVLITLEYLWGDRISDWMAPVPPLIKSHLVVLLSLPVGHLFTADVTMAGFFKHLQQAIPLIEIVNTSR